MALIDTLEMMLAKGQDSALLRYGLGNEYLKQKLFAQAIVHLHKALEFNPRYSAAWKTLGQAFAASGQKDEAIAAFAHGSANAEQQGDIQAAKEMRIYLKRLHKN